MGPTLRREQILRAAERLLGRYGPAKMTIADVAREAEGGVGSVYLEFDSKHAIIEELSTCRYRAVLAAMREAAAKKGRYGERVTAVLDARTACFLELMDQGAHACDVVHCTSSAVQNAAARFREDEQALLVELLQSGVRAGQLSAPRPDAVARSILRAYACFAPPWLERMPRDEV